MLIAYFLQCFFVVTQGYIYHNHISLKQPYLIDFQKKSSKDIKLINEEDAYSLASFWYSELKCQQSFPYENNKEQQNIHYLYSKDKEEYMKMSNMMTFYYQFENEKSQHMEYLIWKPRISPALIDDPRHNSIFYPGFRQTMALVSFECSKNDINVETMISSPFWKGDVNIIQKKSKALLVDYFIGYLKHREVNFES